MELRWYQQEACEAAWDSLCSQRGNPLIDLPTGSGKSLVLAELARRAVEDFGCRVVVLAHRKELLDQNSKKIAGLCNVPCGVYSAGMRSRDTDEPIIVGGIQSIYSRANELGRRHLVIIDEAHLTPRGEDGMYRQFLGDLERLNPKLKIVGLTATPYRLDQGQLWGSDELFTHVCYRADIRRLIEEGHLCNLVNNPGDTRYDTSGLHTRAGEFVRREVEDLFGDSRLVRQACEEIAAKTVDRRSVLVFCSSVAHAEAVRDELERITGERVDSVTGETPKLLRASTLDDFAAGAFRFCVNVDVLTTGFDSPRIDCVAILRATQSAGLFCQMVGRGLRTHPSKTDALIMDFGGNLERHGPIDAVDFGKPKGGKGGGEAPKKTCPGCREEAAAGVRVCECGFRFPPPATNHEAQADSESKILSEPEVFAVEEVYLSRNKGKECKQDTLRVDYICRRDDGDMRETISEWICLEHSIGFPRVRAVGWWKERSDAPVPDNIDDAITLWSGGALADCSRIKAQKQGRWWRILAYELGEKPQSWDFGRSWDDEEVPF